MTTEATSTTEETKSLTGLLDFCEWLKTNYDIQDRKKRQEVKIAAVKPDSMRAIRDAFATHMEKESKTLLQTIRGSQNRAEILSGIQSWVNALQACVIRWRQGDHQKTT